MVMVQQCEASWIASQRRVELTSAGHIDQAWPSPKKSQMASLPAVFLPSGAVHWHDDGDVVLDVTTLTPRRDRQRLSREEAPGDVPVAASPRVAAARRGSPSSGPARDDVGPLLRTLRTACASDDAPGAVRAPDPPLLGPGRLDRAGVGAVSGRRGARTGWRRRRRPTSTSPLGRSPFRRQAWLDSHHDPRPARSGQRATAVVDCPPSWKRPPRRSLETSEWNSLRRAGRSLDDLGPERVPRDRPGRNNK